MRALIAAVVAVVALASPIQALDAETCAIPGYLFASDQSLKRVAAAVEKSRRINILVAGTGSSTLAGPDGPRSAYPARLEAALKRRLPGIAVRVAASTKSRQSAADMVKQWGKLLVDEQPDLVIWQTGTFDAIRRVEPDDFQAALDQGVAKLQAGGADVILMNMQYSPRTESMIDVGPYADVMRVIAQERELPLFDRLAIMRHWADIGAFDLNATSKDIVLAQRVHDCFGGALASLIISAGHLEAVETKPDSVN